MTQEFTIPKEIKEIAKTLEKRGFEAYLVGGCVRDLILNREPRDWDFTTNATPEEIIASFEHTFYENTFGTVGVVNDNAPTDTLKTVEITPYRTESDYSDHRHPDSVTFAKTIDLDLARRDFTINALAYRISDNTFIDLYGGLKDIGNTTITSVGDAPERFTEDALRILRAVRFHAELGFMISHETEKAILELGHLLKKISRERIRDEFTKIIMSDSPMNGLLMLKKLNLLEYIVPELYETIGVEQNKAHSYDVWEHLIRTLQHSADKKWPLDIRLAALFHDISKPASRRWGKEQNTWTFYGHEVLGARATEKILEDLRYPRKLIEKVVILVRWHMFFSDTEQITLSAVRRMVVNVGKENIWDLMNVRICDRIGTGRPKEDPYRLRKYHAMIEEALRDPISVGMLKVDGKRILEITKEPAGPKIGYTLHALLEEVLEDPTKNTPEYLEKRVVDLFSLPISELKELGEQGKETKEEKDFEKVVEIRKKHWVK
jgi:poly(A) polymerase/tRNA nucleotidyltransferase (CCA-adding enzyme)